MTGHGSLSGGQVIAFGSFRLLPARQLLLEGDQQVTLGSRALDILVTLAERAGDVVSKEDLIARVWPNTFVEDSNLRVHISGLRRALRDGQSGTRYVVTVPGRGYSFVAPVSVSQEKAAAASLDLSLAPTSDLPAPPTHIVGRTDVISALAAQLGHRRLVTLVGPGGIGKTTVALAVARAVSRTYSDGVGYVDLSSISDPRLLGGAIATTLGLAINADNMIPTLIAFLRQKETLLVLDSCEHVIEAAAITAEELSQHLPSLHILATSREPLRAAGEYIHRLSPLESPPASPTLTAAEALSFPGVQLFVERAAAIVDGFALSDADAPFVADICRRLDGIPLAIEFAAGRVEAFDLRELSERLDDRLRLLTSGRRTALPRHQTLAATLDWSYELLPEMERTLLRLLAVFAGDFSLDTVVAIAPDFVRSNAPSMVANLVSKSLVVAHMQGGVTNYRLLDTTRLYCLERLGASGEIQLVRRRYAEYFRDFFGPAEADTENLWKADWLAKYGGQIDNVRAALAWCFSPEGDAQLGIALTVAVVPLWVQLSLMSECRDRAERALAHLEADQMSVERARMHLCAALGWSLMFSVGRGRESAAAWNTVLEIAERLGETSCRLRGLWGLWVNHLNQGEFRAALDLAKRFAGIVAGSSDATDLMMADRMVGTSLHYLGEQASARQYIERTIARYDGLLQQQKRIVRFQFDQRVTAQYFHARILWLQGFPDRAMRIVESNVEDAETIDHALSLASALGQGACPVALFAGDSGAARRYGTMLLDHSERHGLRLWHGWARCFDGLLMARQGDVAAGVATMRAELEQVGDARCLPRYLVLLGEFAACLGAGDDVERGLGTIDEALSRAERAEERWYVAELLRIKGELILAGGSRKAAALAEKHFLDALGLAKQQDARSWELRSAISLARLWSGQRRAPEARAVLSEIYGRFSEGFATADLRTARQMLTG